MDKIAEFLIQKETITGKEFMKIFHEAKGIQEPEVKGRIEEKWWKQKRRCSFLGHIQMQTKIRIRKR